MKAQAIFKNKYEAEKYHKENPYAASHPYAGGVKLKPEGAPLSSKVKVAKKMKNEKEPKWKKESGKKMSKAFGKMLASKDTIHNSKYETQDYL